MSGPHSISRPLYEVASLHSVDLSQASHTRAGSVEKYQAELEGSWQNPDLFWDRMAQELDWMKRWDVVRRGSMPHMEWFCGGIANPCTNMLARHVRAGAGNRLALIWEGEDGDSHFFTYAMLDREVNRFANVLKKLGIRKGDPVAIFLPNLAETVVAVLACYLTGAVFNTVFSGFSASALRARLESFAPKLLITADEGVRRGKAIPLKHTADDAIEGILGLNAVVVVRRTGKDISMRAGRDLWWHELMEVASAECEPEPLEANEPGLVFYTSGTTGKPKGVVHAGMAFIVNNYVYAQYHMDHKPNDVLWCTADIGWLTMHIWGIVGALTNGTTTVFYEGALDFPAPDRFYRTIEKYCVNKIFTAPTAIRMLMRHGDDLISRHDVSTLEVIALVGEPLNPEAWQWAYQKLGKGRIYINNTWGQTELGGCPIAGAAWLTPMKPGSCGTRFLAADVDVVDDDGKSLPPNTPGSLVLRQPIPMMLRTLWREPERFISEYFSQIPGCYFTYDTAVRDVDGHFWVLGRLDDVINVAGHRLSTMEMESAIMECDGVAEVAVIGVADPIKGLVPVAFVTLKNGCQASPEMRHAICDGVEHTIGKFAIPACVHFTDAMPKTASGKIMRRVLREIVEQGAVHGDVTGLEDVSSVQTVSKVVHGEGD